MFIKKKKRKKYDKESNKLKHVPSQHTQMGVEFIETSTKF